MGTGSGLYSFLQRKGIPAGFSGKSGPPEFPDLPEMPRRTGIDSMNMTLADFTILYLSLGAPVATVTFLRMARPGKRVPILAAVSAWVAWPAATVYLLGRAPRRRAVLDLLDGGAQSSRNASARSSLIREFDSVAIKSMAASDTFLFRETLERYVALSELLENTISRFEDLPENEFFIAAGGAAPAVGTICLARRNRDRLQQHLSRARTDLVNSMTILPSGESRLAARSALMRLFDSFGDSEGRHAVSASIAGGAAEGTSPSEMIRFKAV